MDDKNEVMLRDGHLTEEAEAIFVEAFVQGKKPGLPAYVLGHVETCKDCKDKILDVTSFLKFPDTATGKKNSRRKSNVKKTYAYRGRIAAAVAAFAVLLSAYVFLENNPDLLKPAESTISQNDMADSDTSDGSVNNYAQKSAMHHPQPTKLVQAEKGNEKRTSILSTRERRKIMMRAAFKVNPNLENMIGSPVRGTSFQSVTPPDNSVVRRDAKSTAPIRFSWKKPLPIPHTLKIVNNTNQELFRYKIKGSSFEFTEKLDAGLYYWKIENSNELLYVGKFKVGD